MPVLIKQKSKSKSDGKRPVGKRPVGKSRKSDSPETVLRRAASRIGVPYERFRRELEAGRKWCSGCREFHPATSVYFGISHTRHDGLQNRCRHSDAEYAMRKYLESQRKCGVAIELEPHERQYPAAAKKIGVTLEEYVQARRNGRKWCSGCQDWHPATREYFGARRAAADGLRTMCYTADRNQQLKKRIARGQKKPREPKAVLLNEDAASTEGTRTYKPLGSAHARAQFLNENVPKGVSAARVSWIKSQF